MSNQMFAQLNGVSFSTTDGISLHNANTTIMLNKVTLIVGSNPAVISKLSQVIAKLQPLTNGSIDYWSHGESEIDESVFRRRVSYLFPEGGLLSNLTVRENLLLPLQYHRMTDDQPTYCNRLEKMLAFYCLEHLIDKRPADLQYPEKKLVGLIRCLLMRPEVLIIEDPLFNIGYYSVSLMVQTLRNLKAAGNTLLITTNEPELIRDLADKIILVSGTKLTELPIEDNKSNEVLDLLKQHLSCPIRNFDESQV